MKIAPISALLFLSFTALSLADEPDYTKREVTDPLLKISSTTRFLPAVKDDQQLGATRDDKHVPPVYKRLWSKQDVIMTEPLTKEKPAEIDFSAITKNSKGILRISARNHPSGDFLLEILKGGTSFKKETIDDNKWEKYTIPFDHEDVVLKNFATGWYCEFCFIDYSISKAP